MPGVSACIGALASIEPKPRLAVFPPAIDRDSFRQCGDYWLDKRNVYFEYGTSLKALAEANCATFRSMGGYGADDHGGWHCGRRMKHCLRGDLLQRIPQDPLYAVDDSSVYCDGKPLPGVDHARWRLLGGHFSGDGSRVYYLNGSCRAWMRRRGVCCRGAGRDTINTCSVCS